MNVMDQAMPALAARLARIEAVLGLDGRHAHTTRFEQLLSDIAAAYQVRVGDITGPRRCLDHVYPRHVFCWLARQGGLSSAAIGRRINRDHAAVLHACAVIEDRLDTEPDFLAGIQPFAATHDIPLPERYRPATPPLHHSTTPG